MKHLIAKLFEKRKPSSQSDVMSIAPKKERVTQEFIMLNTGELVPTSRLQTSAGKASTDFRI